MAVTFNERSTTGLLEISADEDANPSLWGWWSRQFNDWAGEICNPTLNTSAIVSGSGYQDGVYDGVDLFRVATTQTGGLNMKATVTVSGGGVSDVQITTKGNGFKEGDYLYIPDLAQVGGTGSGFQIPVASGDATVGLIKGSEERLNTSNYPVGVQIGVERADSYNFGFMPYRTSSTTTNYMYEIYQYSQSTSNNGYGGYNAQNSTSIASWTDGNGDGYNIWSAYCTEANNRFFFAGDNNYDTWWGLIEAVQDPAEGPWPDREIVSPWTAVWATGSSNFYYRPCLSVIYTTAYSGAEYRTLHEPVDAGILFGNHSMRGRSYTTGMVPDRIYTANESTKPYGQVYQDGATTYKRMTNVFYLRMN